MHYSQKTNKQLLEECGFVQQARLQKLVDSLPNEVTMPHKELSYREIQEEKLRD